MSNVDYDVAQRRVYAIHFQAPERPQGEIAQLRGVELIYRTSRSKHPAHVKEHVDRVVRMQQILEEFASLMKKDARV